MATDKKFAKGFLQSLLMTCEEATFIISREDRISALFLKKIHLRIHLLTCNFCSRFRKQIHYMNQLMMKRKLQEEQITPEFKESLQQVLLTKIEEDKNNDNNT